MLSTSSAKFQFYENGWHDFQPQTSASLLTQHASGASSGSFTFRSVRYDVDFINMRQTNAQTNFQRHVRMLGGAHHLSMGASGTSWEWNEGAQWTLYDATTQATLNAALARGQHIANVTFGRSIYIIDLQNLTQTNSRTRFSRRIRSVGNASAVGSSSSSTTNSTTSTTSSTNSINPATSTTSTTNSSNSSSSCPIIHFQHVDQPIWSTITQWQRVQPESDYNPNDIDLMGEVLGQGGDDEPVVCLQCSTAKIPCIFRASLIAQCLSASNGECPTCKYRYSTPGPQPSGTLVIAKDHRSCSGYADVGSITLTYRLPGGTQSARMLRPGQHYRGTARIAYLPDNEHGAEALKLLTKAFRNGNLFLVGDSVTTGQRNTTIWAGIHQKTNLTGGTARHGYPDPTYFDRLKQECASRGIYTDEHEGSLLQNNTSSNSAAAGSVLNSKSNSDDSDSVPLEEAKTTADNVPIFQPQEGDTTLESRIDHLTLLLNKAMADRDIPVIRDLMKQRNACQARKKVVDENGDERKKER
jgi:hypothetical protein